MSRIELRPYQREAIDAVWDWLQNNDGNCLASIATGGGKSICMSVFIREACERYPGTRVMSLAHVKELLAQNLKALLSVWPDAPAGVWSAGLGSKTKNQVTIAGIQSVHRSPAKFAPVDVVVIDECHLVPRSGNGMYLKFLDALRKYNPRMRVVGWSATPFRSDSGMLTEGADRMFHGIAYETNVGKLINDGFLSPLVAKNGSTKADLSAVHTRGGEFVPGELQAAMDKQHLIQGALDEIEKYANDRQHILGFCAGISHAQHCAEAARGRGWTADYVSGEMTASERDAKIRSFTTGQIRFLFNAMLLTTGFDYPSIDCIVMLRPTKSTGLYVQIMGRGLRKDGVKENTLVLDFSDNIMRHGPIDCVRPPRKKGEADSEGVAPAKMCPDCNELVHPSVMECPSCGHLWHRKPAHGVEASDAVVVAATEKPRVYKVDRVEYRRHEKTGKPPSVKVTYVCGLSQFDEWLPIEDDRHYVRKHASLWCWDRGLVCPDTVDQFLDIAGSGKVEAPDAIIVKMDKRYWRVIDRVMGERRRNVSSVVRKENFFSTEGFF